MANTGPVNFQSFASVSPGTAWSNPSNAQTNDSNYASVSVAKLDLTDPLNPVYSYSETLKCLNPSGHGIVANSVITGIAIVVVRNTASIPGIADSNVQLYRNGSLVGDNKAAGNWAASESKVYGGTGDTWGITDWDASDFDSNWGVGIKVTNVSTVGSRTANIDRVYMTVYYNAPATKSVSDSVSVGVSESMSVTVELTPVDTLSVGVDDSVDLVVQTDVTDELIVGVDEDSIVDNQTVVVTLDLTDELSITFDDGATIVATDHQPPPPGEAISLGWRKLISVILDATRYMEHRLEADKDVVGKFSRADDETVL